ncbi:hypothetical protein [Brevundimonas sp. LM2]|uniref:hypothetical protein n=1 Tax=Brevundimonas sp. LM2 TaxID=1938605 RepID=UPI00123764A2|nr:hypothetical protein [Brevundimonas sp. LM2]
MTTVFETSNEAADETFLAACEAVDCRPSIVWMAMGKVARIRRAKRLGGEMPPPLTDEEEKAFSDYIEHTNPPYPSTGEVIERTGLIDFPCDCADRAAFCRQAYLSAMRKRSLFRDEEMSANEHRALAAHSAWLEMYKDGADWYAAAEARAEKLMPSVATFTDDTFDNALIDTGKVTVVYCHTTKPFGEPKRARRVELLARNLAADCRIARVNLTNNGGIWGRFRLFHKSQPLLLFTGDGLLASISSANLTPVAIEGWIRQNSMHSASGTVAAAE